MDEINSVEDKTEATDSTNAVVKKNKKFIIFSLLAILILGGFLAFNFFQNKDIEEKEPDNSNLNAEQLSMIVRNEKRGMAQFGSVNSIDEEESIVAKDCKIGNEYEGYRGIIVGKTDEKCIIATKNDSVFDRDGLKQWSWWYDAEKHCSGLQPKITLGEKIYTNWSLPTLKELSNNVFAKAEFLKLSNGSGYWTKDNDLQDSNSAIAKFYSDTGTVFSYRKSGKYLRSRCIKSIAIEKPLIVIDAKCSNSARIYEYDKDSWAMLNEEITNVEHIANFCNKVDYKQIGWIDEPKPIPEFPQPGKSVSWICKGKGGGVSAECKASRKSAPDEEEEEPAVSCEKEGEVVCKHDFDKYSTFKCVKNSGGDLTWKANKCDKGDYCVNGKCEVCIPGWCW
jgi:hypothetical protein